MLGIAVITISDRASRGEYEDISGPRIKEIIEASDVKARVEVTVVPDEEAPILSALKNNLDKVKELTSDPKFICKCCGRTANDEENLCAPSPLK